MTKLKFQVLEVVAIVIAIICVFVFYIIEYNKLIDNTAALFYNNANATIKEILNHQRQDIAEEMRYFEYQKDYENLDVLTPESDGTPFRSIILTTWRTGSTFLGEILNSMPGNFYHFEPLLDFGLKKIRGPPHDKRAIYNLKQLLNCNYTDLDGYLNFGKEHEFLFSYNTRLWRYCDLYPQYCSNPKFLTPFCRLFPLQSMKVIRLRLALVEQLLEDRNLNVRIVFLVRDPRATMQSRKRCEWCPGNPDCDQTRTVCNDMLADYYAATNLSIKYPNLFKVVRYEELSLHPFRVTKDILHFYGLPFDRRVREFLESHTKQDIGSIYSTYRNSTSTPFRWMTELTYEEIDGVQTNCSKAMDLWGYKKMDQNLYGDGNFDPLLPSPFS